MFQIVHHSRRHSAQVECEVNTQEKAQLDSDQSSTFTMHCLPLVLTSLVALAFSATIDLDPEDDINEEEFVKYFHVEEEVSDAEKLRREEALVENEKIIKETNEEFLAGKIEWWDEVNKDSDLPPDEFLSEKTGAKIPNSGRGLLEPLEVCAARCQNITQMLPGAKGGREV